MHIKCHARNKTAGQHIPSREGGVVTLIFHALCYSLFIYMIFRLSARCQKTSSLVVFRYREDSLNKWSLEHVRFKTDVPI